MLSKKLTAAIIVLMWSATATAFQICSFDIPQNDALPLHDNGDCSASIAKKINYIGLDYFELYSHSGIEKMLSDDTFFKEEDDGTHTFVSEEIDTPKITIRIKQQEAARQFVYNGMTGYTARARYFVQKLPSSDDKNGSEYSLNVSCLFMAAGTESKSFKTRFCTPETSAGRKQMTLYKSMLEHIHP